MKISLTAISVLYAMTLLTAGIYSSPGKDEQKNIKLCSDIEGRFNSTLKNAAGECKKDKDCSCYYPITIEAKCGGITDRVTAEKLSEIAKEFHTVKCRYNGLRCAARNCKPACIGGRCSFRN